MVSMRVAVTLFVTCAAIGCNAPTKAARDQAYAAAHRMPGLDDTSLTLPTSGANGYPPKTANPLAFRRLVRRGDFATLDSVLTAAADSAHRDYRTEIYLFNAYDAMASDTSLAEPLARWSRERPASAPAHLARAVYLQGQAWAARGSAYARNTPQQSLDRMSKLMAEAKACVDSALALTPQSAEAYLVLLYITKPSGDSALSRRYLAKGLEDIPASFALRRQYLRNLVPRWGGSYEAMRGVADESMAMADSNPRLRALAGYIALDSAEVLELTEHDREAMDAYGRAIGYGDEMQFHLARGQLLVRAGRAREALPDLDFAVAAAPGSAAPYLWRGMARQRLKQDALVDYERAVVLDPTDDVALDRLAWLLARSR